MNINNYTQLIGCNEISEQASRALLRAGFQIHECVIGTKEDIKIVQVEVSGPEDSIMYVLGVPREISLPSHNLHLICTPDEKLSGYRLTVLDEEEKPVVAGEHSLGDLDDHPF